ncbi:MAG: hypothetical protein HQL87_08125 [Magnetococcales bacterium]|nr:hypothetical protein [Magnetococcales bacterium]
MSRILIIDENTSVLSVMQTVLHNLGHEVILASNVREGVLLALFWQPVDLILTDIKQSDPDSFDWMARIIQRIPERPAGTQTRIMELSCFYCFRYGDNVLGMAQHPRDGKSMAAQDRLVLRHKLARSIANPGPVKQAVWGAS